MSKREAFLTTVVDGLKIFLNLVSDMTDPFIRELTGSKFFIKSEGRCSYVVFFFSFLVEL